MEGKVCVRSAKLRKPDSLSKMEPSGMDVGLGQTRFHQREVRVWDKWIMDLT